MIRVIFTAPLVTVTEDVLTYVRVGEVMNRLMNERMFICIYINMMHE